MLYVHRNRRLIREGSPGRPPRLSHSSTRRLIRDGSQGRPPRLSHSSNRRLIRDGSPRRPPRLSHSSRALMFWGQANTLSVATVYKLSALFEFPSCSSARGPIKERAFMCLSICERSRICSPPLLELVPLRHKLRRSLCHNAFEARPLCISNSLILLSLIDCRHCIKY